MHFRLGVRRARIFEETYVRLIIAQEGSDRSRGNVLAPMAGAIPGFSWVAATNRNPLRTRSLTFPSRPVA